MSSLSALMEFLRLLCENHYLEMQDYMRKQPDNLRSYNVVRTCDAGAASATEDGKTCVPARSCSNELDRDCCSRTTFLRGSLPDRFSTRDFLGCGKLSRESYLFLSWDGSVSSLGFVVVVEPEIDTL